uniref:Peptidase metallopeptidase domain-containing protein n=1 Tax=Seriola lalandi dorsalis TaxID=1841481 RepID=A0A3B4WTG9_SERLL
MADTPETEICHLIIPNPFLSPPYLRVRTFPKDSALLGRDTVRALMYYALKVWSDIAPLNFHEVAGSDADIQIDFTKADHNDGYPFDGPGGTVAHAFFPGERFTAGDTHFDDDEAWTFRSPGEELLFERQIWKGDVGEWICSDILGNMSPKHFSETPRAL